MNCWSPEPRRLPRWAQHQESVSRGDEMMGGQAAPSLPSHVHGMSRVMGGDGRLRSWTRLGVTLVKTVSEST